MANSETTIVATSEIERLRNALKLIRDMRAEPICGTEFATGSLALFQACQRIAREALKGKL